MSKTLSAPSRSRPFAAGAGRVLSALLGVTAVIMAGGALAAPAPKLDFTDAELSFAATMARDPVLASAYGARGLVPIFDPADPKAQARRQAVLDAVENASAHGLPPARYHAETLRGAMGDAGPEAELLFAQGFTRWVHDLSGGLVDPRRVDPLIHRTVERPDGARLLADFADSPDPAGVLAAVEPKDPRYGVLKDALARQGGLIAPPGTPKISAPSLKPGDRGPAVTELRARLASVGFDAVAGDDYDDALRAEIARYQDKVGLGADGVAGPRTIGRLNRDAAPQDRAILIAMERFRWLGNRDPMARQVWVNLPEYVAHIYDGGEEVFSTRVVVGKATDEFATPEFSDEMEYVVVNPRWNVPRSITTKEYLPRLQKNPNAASQLDIIDGRGRVIPRNQINFGKYTAANFPYRMRQKPSDDNALGQVKFIFPNPWNIYLHDTPSKGLFGNATRAYSHGCVRIGRPVDLAHQLLSGQVKDPAATYDRALKSGNETWLKLKPTIPVHLVYFTLIPDANGQMKRYPDVYGRDAKVWAAMTKAGLATD